MTDFTKFLKQANLIDGKFVGGVPFGGLKESGLGKKGDSQGPDDYLDTKYTCVAGV